MTTLKFTLAYFYTLLLLLGVIHCLPPDSSPVRPKHSKLPAKFHTFLASLTDKQRICS